MGAKHIVFPRQRLNAFCMICSWRDIVGTVVKKYKPVKSNYFALFFTCMTWRIDNNFM